MRVVSLMAIVFTLVLAPVTLLQTAAQEAQAATEEPVDVVTRRETAPSASSFVLTPLDAAFTYPLHAASAGDETGRLFVVEQAGRIEIIDNGTLLATTFIDLSAVVSQDILSGYSERGLLGLAFHPDFEENGEFFVNYTRRSDGGSVVARYRVSESDPNVADPGSEEILLTLDQPYPNHNGGHLAFGPDGYLYIAFGDGGAANDPLLTGQDPTDWYGSILRIDVDNGAPYGIPDTNPFADGALGAPEVWAYGLRNAWRFSFDRATQDVYIADVGQNIWEEVNFVAADEAGGQNFGWNAFEGAHPFASNDAPRNMTYPAVEYSHREGGCSITGGYVYRGDAIPDLQGVYFFGDYCTGLIWGAYRDASGTWQKTVLYDLDMQLSSFAEDETGELYVVGYGGTIYQFAPAQ